MKKLFILIQVLLSITGITPAQNNPIGKNFVVKGHLVDSLQNQQVSDATVSLENAKDSSLVAFARADSSGNFLFRHLQPGKYRVSVSQVNFHPLWKNFEITASDKTLDLGKIYMKDKSVMEVVTVQAQRPPVVVNGDTLEFNAEAFKTKPNAVVEDLLKKMPGVEVEKDGTIRVNGIKINRVLVNGKDFFNGDPKIATRNLAADVIDKVQVFDKQSDQSTFTGVDDGNAEKTINLKLKKDKKNAAFGKISVAGGTKDRYDGQFNINRFKGEQQLSVIGMVNNTNRQGFSIMDMLNFTGQSRRMMNGGGSIVINNGNDDEFGLPVAGINNSQGITNIISGGFNYNDKWKKKTEVNASYFHNSLTNTNDRTVNRQNISPGNDFNYDQAGNSNYKSQSNRLNFSIDNKIDSFNSIKLTSSGTYQKGNSVKQTSYTSFMPGDKMLNSGSANIMANTEGYVVNNDLLYRHKFKKRGRTLSAGATIQYNDSRAHGTQYTISNYYSNGIISQRDTLNQVTRLTSLTQTYGANLNYTEPLSKRSLLEFKTAYNTNSGDLDRKVFDYNKSNGKHDMENGLLSNAFKSRYRYISTGISMRTQKKKYGYTVGVNEQFALLRSRLKDSAFSVQQHFFNILPMANLTYNFTRFKFLRVDYATSTTSPTASQLQPVKDVSDPLNIKQGNPSVKQSYFHNLELQFFNGNPSKQKNLFAFINYTATQNAIVNSDMINAAGIRTTTPANTNGNYSVMGNVERGFRIKKLNTHFDIGTSLTYNRSVNFINEQKNKTGTLSFSPRVSAQYAYKEKLDISLDAVLSYNQARYSLQPSLNNNYWRQEYNVEANINLPAGFSINNNIAYTVYTGRSGGYNTRVALWNAFISKQVFKSKKGEVRLSGFDLLNQNTGIDRNANSDYVEDVHYKTLQRYFTLGFTYSLQKASSGGPRAVIRSF
jgi:hypothetical protein